MDGNDVRREGGAEGEAVYREASRQRIAVDQRPGKWSSSFVATLVLWALCSGKLVSAQDSDTGTTTSPTFGGEFLDRSKLTGDWGGLRSRLARNGITLDADVTQFYQGVTSGGRKQTFEYGGHGDYVLNVDAGKLAGLTGLFLTVRAEHRFGENINQETGTLLPAAVAANLPASNSRALYFTDVLVTQFLSDSFALFAGKMQTLDGDMNDFAHGRGKDQFLNMAFVADIASALTIPYSTLGAGFVLVKDTQPWLSVTVLNATDTTTTAGFNELFKHGVAVSPEMRLPTRFFDRPGHQLIGATWNSKDFLALGQDPRFDISSSAIPLEKRQSAWSVYWNFDQYLAVDPQQPSRGWGIFGRAGYADKHSNPLNWYVSAGLGGQSPIPGRGADTFGIGWYYAKTSSELGRLAQSLLGPVGDGQGAELFYNIAATPWLHLTPDLQILKSAVERLDTAIVLGFRAKADF